MGNFKELNVWIRSKNLAVYIYKLINQNNKLSKDFGMKDQLQRSAVSISAKIAEGEQLDSDKQSIRHLYISRGSTAELRSLSIVTHEVGYIDKQDLNHIETECTAIAGMLTRLINSRS